MRRRSERTIARELAVASERGFTLLEGIVVLAIAAVLCGAAVPYAAGVLAELELRNASVRVAAALVRGRSAALRDGRTWVLLAAGRTLSLAPLGAQGERESLPDRVAVASSTSGGEVRFSPNGLAENATFRIVLGARERRVVVNQRGRISLE
jgi:prepilin-type N-terminal cleavage/methylation domain-containing protein